MAWTTPRTWATTDFVDAADLNEQIRDNFNHLYTNLPQRATLWHDSSDVIAGLDIATALTASQPYCFYAYQNTAADGDSWTQSFVLGAGTYDFHILCRTNNTGGKVDFDLDGVSIATGVDFYSAGATLNVIKTVASVVVATGQRHVLTGTVNGKHASSSNYYVWITKMWWLPSAGDS